MPQHFVVAGAGAFGGWTALHLLRAGHRVTLVDPWGPGHSRASSGGETRIIRGSYGPNAIYTDLVAESLPLWRENERRWGVRLLNLHGSLWISGAASDRWEQASAASLETAGLPFERIEPAEGRKRFPQMNWDGLGWAILEHEAGFLMARRGCQAVLEGFLAENGTYVRQAAEPGGIAAAIPADGYIFACGPWLPRLFPEVIGDRIVPTRQEVFFFGTPAGDARFDESQFPAWVDNSTVRFYGIPGNEHRGFKVAEDTPRGPFDPTSGDRTVSAAGLALIRDYVGMRFPALRGAPLVESRVCQYEMSADGGVLLDRVPGRENIWILGGGSGHGYKFSPALGRLAARCLLGETQPPPLFRLARFQEGQPAFRERK